MHIWMVWRFEGFVKDLLALNARRLFMLLIQFKKHYFQRLVPPIEIINNDVDAYGLTNIFSNDSSKEIHFFNGIDVIPNTVCTDVMLQT